jgi:hypothetical protein
MQECASSPSEPNSAKEQIQRAFYEERIVNINFYPKELNYVNAMLADPKPGDFLRLFLQACVHADTENYELLRPIVKTFMNKYPADPERLRCEEDDSGTKSK